MGILAVLVNVLAWLAFANPAFAGLTEVNADAQVCHSIVASDRTRADRGYAPQGPVAPRLCPQCFPLGGGSSTGALLPLPQELAAVGPLAPMPPASPENVAADLVAPGAYGARAPPAV